MPVIYEQFNSNETTVSNVNSQSRAELMFLFPVHAYSRTGVTARIRITNEPQFHPKKYFRPIIVRVLYVIFSAHLQIQSTLDFYFVQFHPAVYVYLIVYYLMSVLHS
jgi:hypothetical protein